jgi:hypothetical protein
MTTPSLVERFWSRVSIDTGTTCWNWIGKKDRADYGVFYISGDKRNARAHRFSYELHLGTIPEGLVLDHLCRNKRCVNPEHLEPVTQRENVRRGTKGYMRYERECCTYGHPFSETAVITARGRSCKVCVALYRRLLYTTPPAVKLVRKAAGLPVVDLAAYFRQQVPA